MQTKYIIISKEWRDKANGNSYFSAQIENTANGKLIAKLPFQYGYGDHSLNVAIRILEDKGLWEKVTYPSEYPIKYINIPNSLKRDVIRFGE